MDQYEDIGTHGESFQFTMVLIATYTVACCNGNYGFIWTCNWTLKTE